MLKAKVKDFVHMMNIGMMVQDDDETITQEEYANRHGDEYVIGFWIVDINTIGIYTNSKEEFEYWNNRLERGK